jgi:hypothetical protein
VLSSSATPKTNGGVARRVISLDRRHIERFAMAPTLGLGEASQSFAKDHEKTARLPSWNDANLPGVWHYLRTAQVSALSYHVKSRTMITIV